MLKLKGKKVNKEYQERIQLIEKNVKEKINDLGEQWFSSSFDQEVNQELTPSQVPQIGEILAYATDSGKRIRPLLMLLSFESILDEKIENLPSFYDKHHYVLDFATALECIHAYSLVHDDLPSMDNDTYRRGKLTVHAKYGEGLAILAGDALLNYAYELIFNTMSTYSEKINNLVLAGKTFSNLAGLPGMIGGQVYDLSPEFLNEEEKVQLMVEKKTCALLRIASQVGAILAGANEDSLRALDQYAFYLGLAYQAKDDIFDIDQDKEEGKITLLKGKKLEESEELVKTYTYKAYDALKNVQNNHVLIDYSAMLMNRKN